MKRIMFSSDDACPYCAESTYDVAATLIVCVGCGATWGRVNGFWVVDKETIPVVGNCSTRLTDSTVNTEASNNGNLLKSCEKV